MKIKTLSFICILIMLGKELFDTNCETNPNNSAFRILVQPAKTCSAVSRERHQISSFNWTRKINRGY